MTILRSAVRLILATGAVFMLGAPVQAQSAIVYVSAGGKDANACTFAAPCRLLQRALTVVQSRGVVQVLNSAAYGSVTIAKSVTISGGGNVATGTRIYINSASAVVTLRGLAMDGRGVGATGILIDNAAAVHIEGCAIERYAGDGIVLDGANTELFVADTVSRENGGDGLRVNGAGTTATLTVDNSRFENNGANGILQAGGTASITWTTAANNSLSGYRVTTSGQLTLESSVASGNADSGLYVHTSTARISNNVVTNNVNAGIYTDTSTVLSRQNNTVSGNAFDNPPGSYTALGGV